MLTGFFVAIPVFFDVAFIILVPVIYMLQRKTKKSLLLYGIPLLAGLAATHAFVPPTPGPVAVADILKADLGWVILFGFIAGLPAAILSGPVFGNFIGKKIFIEAPAVEELKTESENYPWIGLIIGIIGIPIFLIVFNTFLTSPILPANFISPNVKKWVQMIGHPFSALILANLIAWYFLGIKRGTGKETLFKITGKSLAPAGIIILLTGAGGVFKEMLIKTGSGDMLANYFSSLGFSIFFFAYLSAALVRMLQGSATVAMITAAGVTAPLMSTAISEMDKALLVIAIASGASILSHVNDSGFWLVSKYLGLNEKQTFKSWTVMTTILSLTGFFCVLILSAIL
jgi:Gnt-I system low-affinity gluconate transporter